MNQIEQQIVNIFQQQTQQALQAYDFNRDGVIEKNELVQLIQQAGYDFNTANQLTYNIFSNLDADGNGYISLADFRA